ncbi:MAG: hypothetical protein JOZ93_09175 [Sinobacteraceae bacterium]|nr:hypothetical protein [Nevskiaceae bacterium]
MTHAPGVLLRMTGAVSCHCDANQSRFLLAGLSADSLCEQVTVAFFVQPPADMPAHLDDVCVERLPDQQICIAASGRRWVLPAHGCFVHREVAERFYQAIAPRRVPLSKRLFWRVVLLLAGNPLGRRLLLLLRR